MEAYNGPANVYTAVDLQQGTTYKFRVKAVNAFGNGTYSGDLFVRTTQTTGVAYTPVAPTITVSNSQVIVSGTDWWIVG